MIVQTTKRLKLNTPLEGKIIKSGSKLITKKENAKTKRQVEVYGCDIVFSTTEGDDVNVSFIADPKLDVGDNYLPDEGITKFTNFCLRTKLITEKELQDKTALELIEKRFATIVGKTIKTALDKNKKGFYQPILETLEVVD